MINAVKELSDEVKEKLNEAKSDSEACRIIIEAGVDVEPVEKELRDESLNNIFGGWDSLDGRDYHCPNCGNNNRDKVSYQFWASMFMDSTSKYRCELCNHYFKINSYGSITDLGPAD